MEINCDAGEISREVDDAILPYVSAVNVSCNAHAGDEALVRGTVAQAVALGVKIGAHPSWPDRANFGRKSMDLSPQQLQESIVTQICWLLEIVEQEGGVLCTVKPHGALYHDAISHRPIAAALIEAVRSVDGRLAIVGMAGSELADDCRRAELRFVPEAFADRRYETATQLCSRSKGNAVIDDPEAFEMQLGLLAEGKVKDVQGEIHSINAETICLHSDTPNAAQYARIAHEFFSA